MTEKAGSTTQLDPLVAQLRWFIRLRWLAALAVLLGAWINYRWVHWSEGSIQIALIGAAIFCYNALLRFSLRPTASRPLLLALSWAQLLLDVTCLTELVLLTGATQSPLVPFYVFHMVFASLLLSRLMAYAVATVAAVMYCGGIWLNHGWPALLEDRLMMLGQIAALFGIVHLANHITRGLRRQRKRLLKQNRRIRVMTRQLRRQQKAMIQHEKMVALGHMAAGVTHEIANPLASMDSVLQLMQRKPERVRPEAVATLREQIARINQIIQQMKTFAHPADVQTHTADLNEIVEQSLHMLRFDKRLNQVQIERAYSPDAGSLSLLPQALQQVLVNLIINALDAMAQTPEPKLLIRTERREGWCIVEVADNGPGIAPEHMGRLFEPFFTTKPVGKGTGLGLSISYSLVQKQGGSISVRSHPGRGTSFSIRLPISTQDARVGTVAAPAGGK